MKDKLQVWLVENADLLVGIILSMVVAVLGLVGVVSSKLLSAAVLAVLALQLGVVARVRNQLNSYASLSREQAPILKQLYELLSGRGSVASVYRHDYPDLSSEIEQATSVDILAGLSLKTTVLVYATAIEVALQRGARFRVVCPNPDNPPLMEAAAIASAYRDKGSEASEDVRMHLLLAKRLKDLSAGTGGDLQIRVVDTLPGVGVVRILGPDGTNFYVKLMIIGAKWGGYPVFCLSEKIDGNLCEDLKRTFEATWKRSATYG